MGFGAVSNNHPHIGLNNFDDLLGMVVSACQGSFYPEKVVFTQETKNHEWW